MTQKNALVALPAELVEQIASYLDKPDLISFHSSSYEIAGKSIRAFKASCFNSIKWGERKIAQISEHPECAKLVHSVKIELETEKPDSEVIPDPTFTNLKLLTNLRSLEISDQTHYLSWHKYPSCFAYAHLESLTFPQLKTLVLSGCKNKNNSEAVTRYLTTFITRHKSTLTTIRLHDVILSRLDDWLLVLNSTKDLSNSKAIVHISTPSCMDPHDYGNSDWGPWKHHLKMLLNSTPN